MRKSSKTQKGEIILIILLVMAVGLTIGLSVAGRSLTDIRLSTQIEESNRAFSAAEAGIEDVLRQGLLSATGGPGTIGDAKYNVTLTSVGGSASQFSFPSVIQAGDAQVIWLVPHNASGADDSTRAYSGSSIEICWSKIETTPALEISLLFKSGSNYKVARAAYDPDSTRTNNFSSLADPAGSYCTSGNENYTYHVNLIFADLSPAVIASDIPLALRLRPVYANSKLAVKPASGATLPEQGKNIVSTGQTNSGVTRKWNVIQTYSAPNDIFDYAIWSNTNLTK